MHDGVGIIKDIDNIGRIVIPKEMRELFNLKEEVELVITEQGVLLRNPRYELVKKINAVDE